MSGIFAKIIIPKSLNLNFLLPILFYQDCIPINQLTPTQRKAPIILKLEM